MKIDPAKRLLLISTSTVFGTGYLDHAESEILDHLEEVSRVLFIPYALFDHEAYAAKVRERFERMHFGIDSIHEAKDPRQAVVAAEAVFIGGGNTFRLLKALYDHGVVEAIRERAAKGMPYMGASAGSNVAGPTIRTTNDMPILEPPTLDALNLFPWQINPHYIDADPTSKHMGETREERLLQYMEENETPVIGLREGAILRIRNGEVTLRGQAAARLFRRGFEPLEIGPGNRVEL
jgi:dipeptidase E